jgi:hypothetical protein
MCQAGNIGFDVTGKCVVENNECQKPLETLPISQETLISLPRNKNEWGRKITISQYYMGQFVYLILIIIH